MASRVNDVEEFLSTARDRFEFGREADRVDREAAESDNKFAYAEDSSLGQWDPKAVRARENRPTMQWNRLPTFTQQVANDGRQNRPAIKIGRGDEASTLATAEFFTGRIRQIEYESNVDTAKDTARDQQIATGRGALRVKTEWIPGTQRQRIQIKKIDNQFSVVWDPSAQNYDRSDADWCFVISQISEEEHIRRFGKDSVLAHIDFATTDQNLAGWVGVGDKGELIQIAEYWRKEWETVTVPASDGQKERKEKQATICQYLIDGAQIHEETVWLGSTIPIAPMWGKQAVIDGKPRTFSLIRNAKEPQRNLNLAISNLFEQLGQQSKTPWMIPVGGVPANMEDDWKNVHITPLGYLLYNSRDTNDDPIPAPTRNTWEPAIQAVVEAANFCIDAMKASMGIFDAALGRQSNETSGIAIENRKKESDVTNYHFPDNEVRTNKYLGEILVELIPKLDRPGSSVPVRTEDGKTHIVPIGVEHEDWKTGEKVTHDLMSGQYGVYVSTAPGFETARQETADRDSQLVTALPEMLYAIGGQMLRAEDSPGAEERATAWEQYVSLKIPGMKFGKDGKGPQEIPPQVQQQLQAQSQELQQTKAFAQSLHEQIQTEQVKAQQAVALKQLDLQFQREKLAVDDQNEKLKIASVEGIEELAQQVAVLMNAHKLAHAAQQADAQRAHAVETQTADQAHADTQQDASQQHQTELQESGQEAAAEQQEAAQQAAESEGEK